MGNSVTPEILSLLIPVLVRVTRNKFMAKADRKMFEKILEMLEKGE